MYIFTFNIAYIALLFVVIIADSFVKSDVHLSMKNYMFISATHFKEHEADVKEAH